MGREICQKVPHRIKVETPTRRPVVFSTSCKPTPQQPQKQQTSVLSCGCIRPLNYAGVQYVLQAKTEAAKWFAVLLVRNNSVRKTRPVRISIRITPSIEELLQRPVRSTSTTRRKTVVDSGWGVIAMLGPILTEGRAKMVCSQWNKGDKESIKAYILNAEDLSKRYDIPIYVDADLGN